MKMTDLYKFGYSVVCIEEVFSLQRIDDGSGKLVVRVHKKNDSRTIDYVGEDAVEMMEFVAASRGWKACLDPTRRDSPDHPPISVPAVEPGTGKPLVRGAAPDVPIAAAERD